MSQAEEDDTRPWTEYDLKEAVRRINAGEINLKEAENYYGISPRTITRQRAIENMRAQLNPEKAKKMKSAGPNVAKKDFTVLRKPVEMSCSSISGIVSLLSDGTEEVKQLLNHECDLIYECKVCKSLFRSFLNFISHKRVYCCDMYSVVHTQSNGNGNPTVMTDPSKVEENLKAKENLKEFTSRPFRITCRKDLTTVLKRITSLSSEFVPAEPILHLQNMENTTCALQQTIKTNQLVKESVAKSTNSTSENLSAVPQVELKKENILKSPDKIVSKPCTYVTTKRFKCPLCPSNYTTKKSVLRHLKSVHHKSVEQLERLKPRVQMFVVKKKNVATTKNVSSPTSKQTTVTATPSISVQPKISSTTSSGSSNGKLVSPNSVAKNKQKLDQGDRERVCSVCNRQFVNKTSYASHLRSCRKNASSNDDTDSTSDASVSSLVPIVSLTPIVTSNYGRKEENDSSSTTKKITSMASHSKKVGISLDTSSVSSSKKIGIQVRMNYRKDGINQSNSTNSMPIGYTTPSGLLVNSTDSSRRSSTVSTIHDEKSDSMMTDLLNGRNTRSKLAHILKSLYDKRGIKDENEDPKNTSVMKEKNEVSIYCEDCKTTYALNDYKWNSENGILRNYKCALNGCDFRSTCKSELLPHLSDRHPILTENELSEVDSIFIAESSGMPTNSEKCCCHKGTSKERSNDGRKREATVNARDISLQNASPPKRRLNAESEEKMAKRKVVIGLKKKDNLCTVDDKIGKETASAVLTDVNKTEVEKHQNLKTEKKIRNYLLLKKKKKIVPKEGSVRPFRIRAKKQTPVDTAMPDGTVPNGLKSLSDEQTQLAVMRMARKQNLSTEESKIAPKLPKINSSVDSTPFSLAPYPDLDPVTMTEENLKKSVMTIIFGKDMSDENVEANFVDPREKSPSSSSASSDSGKEKRYGLRPGKTVSSTSNKIIIASSLPENKDEKVIKSQILNKVKNATR